METVDADPGRVRSSERRQWHLRFVFSCDPAWQDKRLSITGEITFGRRGGGEAATVLLEDRLVSRMHASLRMSADGSRLELEDKQSRNGTYIDGERTRTGTIRGTTVLRIGQSVLLVDDVPVGPARDDPQFVGSTQALWQMLDQVDKVATSNLSVLVLGETGTGKELLARRVHAQSPRAKGPLVDVNCAALPPELAEAALFGHVKGAFTGALRDSKGYAAAADGGTLFLDEVNELPLPLQAKLLRLLETHEFRPVGSTEVSASDFRLVAATNADLAAEVEAGTFRRDLYARLAHFVVRAPPLRERRADILPIAHTFLSRAGKRDMAFSAEVVEALLLYAWPMNIRELKSTMERLAVLAPDDGLLTPEQLPPELLPRRPGRAAPVTSPVEPVRSGAEPNKEELTERLRAAQGNVSELARHYGKHTRQIYRWLTAHGLDAEQFREADESAMPPESELREALAANAGRVSQAARKLGVRREQMYVWMKRLGIDPESYRKS